MVMQQAAEHRIPHWSGRWSPDGEHRAAPRQAGGGMDGHGPRRGGVKMALHLGYEPTIRVNVDAQHLADCRQHQRRRHAPRLRGRGRQSPEDIHDGPKPSRLGTFLLVAQQGIDTGQCRRGCGGTRLWLQGRSIRIKGRCAGRNLVNTPLARSSGVSACRGRTDNAG